MTGVTAALLVVLGLTLPPHVPDLQVEAATSAGEDLPELADAVARALVASGAHVVLHSPTSGPCLYCAKVAVVQTSEGQCRVEVSQDRRAAAAVLQFPAASPLLDRARAIAIQARMLVTWDTTTESRTRDTAARPPGHRAEPKPDGGLSESSAARAESGPPPVAALDGFSNPFAGPERAPGPASTAERTPEAKHASPEKSAAPAERKPPQPEPAVSRRARPAEASAVRVAPARKRWPWIPTLLGSGAAVAAGICALVARERYDGLSDRSQSYASALALKDSGESWQTASFVLAGVAAVGFGTGIFGFATRAAVAPLPGGGMVALAGAFP